MIHAKHSDKETKSSPKIKNIKKQCSESIQNDRRHSKKSKQLNIVDKSCHRNDDIYYKKNKSTENENEKCSFISQQTSYKDLEKNLNREYKAWWEKSDSHDARIFKSDNSSSHSELIKDSIKQNIDIVKHHASLVYPISKNKYKSIPFTFSIHCNKIANIINDGYSEGINKCSPLKSIKITDEKSSRENNIKRKNNFAAIDSNFQDKSRQYSNKTSHRLDTDLVYSKTDNIEPSSRYKLSNKFKTKDNSNFSLNSYCKEGLRSDSSNDKSNKLNVVESKNTRKNSNEEISNNYKTACSKTNSNYRKKSYLKTTKSFGSSNSPFEDCNSPVNYCSPEKNPGKKGESICLQEMENASFPRNNNNSVHFSSRQYDKNNYVQAKHLKSNSLNKLPKYLSDVDYKSNNPRSSTSHESNVKNSVRRRELASSSSDDFSIRKREYPLWKQLRSSAELLGPNLKQPIDASISNGLYTKIIQSSTRRNIPKNNKSKNTYNDLSSQLPPESIHFNQSGAEGIPKQPENLKSSAKGQKITLIKSHNNSDDFRNQNYENNEFDGSKSNNPSLNTNYKKEIDTNILKKSLENNTQQTKTATKTQLSPSLKQNKMLIEDNDVKLDETIKKKELKPLVHYVNGKHSAKVNTKEKLNKFNLGDAMAYTLYGANSEMDKNSHKEKVIEPNSDCNKHCSNVIQTPVCNILSQVKEASLINSNFNKTEPSISPSSNFLNASDTESNCLDCYRINNPISSFPNFVQNKCNKCNENTSFQSNSYNFNKINVPIISKFPSGVLVDPTQIPHLLFSTPTTNNMNPNTPQADFPVYFNGFGMIRNFNRYYCQPEAAEIRFPTQAILPINSSMIVPGSISQLHQNEAAFNALPMCNIGEHPYSLLKKVDENIMPQPKVSQTKDISNRDMCNSFHAIKEEGRKIAIESSSGKSMAEILHGTSASSKFNKYENSSDKQPVHSNVARSVCESKTNSKLSKANNNHHTGERKLTGIVPGLF